MSPAMAGFGQDQCAVTIVNLTGQAGIWLIFRGLFFEHNTEIGQKGHLWMDTRLYDLNPASVEFAEDANRRSGRANCFQKPQPL
ncbi:MAG: hypothetical protein B5M55_08340 [Desulfococcus sp. 4484_242]|nr:MAG: hypothetical protein B5M55_08340 [Desulfococcus sp. 4484_242]